MPTSGSKGRGDTVVLDRVGLRRRVAFSLPRDDVQELRSSQRLEVAQRRQQRREIVAVDGADIVEAELLEERPRHDQSLDVLLCAARELPHRGHPAQRLPAALAHARIELSGEHLGEALGEGAHVGGDGHLVVVEHHEEVGLDVAGVVERLERHAAGETPVADDRDHPSRRAALPGANRHAERGAHRGARVAHPEGVEGTLRAPGEGCESSPLAYRAQPIPPAGENLVRIGLVADVPHDAVLGGVVEVVQSDRQLDRAEPGREVPGGLRHALDEELPQLPHHSGQLRLREAPEVYGALNPRE